MGDEATVGAMTAGRLINTGAVDLWVHELESTSDGAAGPVLLLTGSDSPALRWSTTLVDALAQAGHAVIVYDHRDSGRSAPWPADRGYNLDDLAADAVGVLDALGHDSVHVIGYSMGAMIGQLLALDHAPRVRSLTLIASSPGPVDDRLVGPDAALVEQIEARLWLPLPTGRDGRIDWLVERQRLYAGLRGIDEAAERTLAALEVDQCWRPETGHGPAVAASPSRLDRLASVVAPTLVVHGEADRLFPLPHAEVTVAAVPGATLVIVPELGHELPEWLWPAVWPRLRAHLVGC